MLSWPLQTYRLSRTKIFPFHHDPYLKATIKKLITRHEIKTFFETGTFKGDTVRWMADNYPKLQCVSVENQRRYYLYALERTPQENVRLIHGDSAETLVHEILRFESPILFWLDAHWGNDTPLLKEVGAILKSRTKFIAIIDDFKVPGSNLGFDSPYGRPLDMDFIKPAIGSLPVFLPDYTGIYSQWWGGRGYAVVANLTLNIEGVRLKQVQ